MAKKGIATAPQVEEPEPEEFLEGPYEEPTEPIVSERFGDAPTENRPVNVYVEKVKGQHVLWWTTEQGGEGGRKAAFRRDERLKEDIPIGHDYTQVNSQSAREKLVGQAYGATKYYTKDGSAVHGITEKEFLSADSI